jgi:hypothetical protein
MALIEFDRFEHRTLHTGKGAIVMLTTKERKGKEGKARPGCWLSCPHASSSSSSSTTTTHSLHHHKNSIREFKQNQCQRKQTDPTNMLGCRKVLNIDISRSKSSKSFGVKRSDLSFLMATSVPHNRPCDSFATNDD